MGQCLGRQVKPLPRSRRPEKKTAVPVTTANGSGLQNSTLYAIDGESDKNVLLVLVLRIGSQKSLVIVSCTSLCPPARWKDSYMYMLYRRPAIYGYMIIVYF